MDVVVLASDHPQRRPRELARDVRPPVRKRKLERLGEQGVAVQDRRRLVELDVRRGAASPDVVVVQRRQVVVDHPERVHELDRRRRREQLPGSAPIASPLARQSRGRIRLPPPSRL